MNGTNEPLEALLARYGQEHLIQFKDRLSEKERQELERDLKSLDYERVTRIFNETTRPTTVSNGHANGDLPLEPLSPEVHQSIERAPQEAIDDYRKRGLKAISENRVAALLLAGGQGTRLGVNYPKGMYDVGLPSRKTLYQLQGERLRRLQQLAADAYPEAGNCRIPWYIMTSEHTLEPTENFFKEHNYFGLNPDDVVIFEQNTLPCFDFDGKILLETPSRLARAPDGNGGLYNALRDRDIIEDMRNRGVQCVHVYCVDNILVKMADPIFIGYCLSRDAEAGAKVVDKAFPTEAVGIICKVQGKFQVVEYSEVPLEIAERREPDGRLTFNAGNICNHFFTVDFLDRVSNGPELKHHIAKKKIPYVDAEGRLVKPEKPNGIKLEKFVFDAFVHAERFAVWEVIREDEFSPLKNGIGAEKDTPLTARQALYHQHLRYVLNAGGALIDEDDHIIPLFEKCTLDDYASKERFIVEVSPLLSYDGEGLQEVCRGKRFRSPLLLAAPNEPVPYGAFSVALQGSKKTLSSREEERRNEIRVENGIL